MNPQYDMKHLLDFMGKLRKIAWYCCVLLAEVGRNDHARIIDLELLPNITKF